MIDVCCLQEVRLRGQCAMMLGMKGRRYKLWWSGTGDGFGGVGVMVKEVLCEKVVEVRGVGDKVMTVVVDFEEDVLRFNCGYAPQSGGSLEEKQSFYDELKYDWDMHSAYDLVMCLGDFNGHIGRHIYGFDGVYRGYGVSQRNLEGRKLLELCLVKELCGSNTLFKREKNMIFRMGENETEIDFVCVKERTSTVDAECELNPWVVSACISDDWYR